MTSPAGRFDYLLRALAEDSSVYLHDLNLTNDTALIVRTPFEQQQSAAFLDQRAITPQTEGAWFPWRSVEKRLPVKPPAPPRYVFHHGHCGSTLVSRLVAAATGTAAFREPVPLRALAFDRAEGANAWLTLEQTKRRLQALGALWSRSGDYVVKATSICTDLCALLGDQSHAIFLHQDLETHLAVMLAGDNALADIRGFASLRRKRLAARLKTPPLAEISPGALAALAWLSEISAADAAGLRIFNFDRFLAAPADSLMAVCEALSLPVSADDAARAVAGPIMGRYSKSVDHPYDAGLRARIIASSKRDQWSTIREGMVFVENITKENPELAPIIAKFNATTCDADYG